MTEIPAKTPRPIGNTASFFPGIWNAASLVVAAATDPEGTALVVAELESGAEVAEVAG
jgi:hypothetical protein